MDEGCEWNEAKARLAGRQTRPASKKFEGLSLRPPSKFDEGLRFQTLSPTTILLLVLHPSFHHSLPTNQSPKGSYHPREMFRSYALPNIHYQSIWA